MRWRHPSLRALGVAFALALVTPVLASTVLALPLPELTNRADRVVRAQVAEQVSRWDAGGERIHTYTTLHVLEALKGEGEAVVVVRQLGGQVGDTAARLAGDAVFQVGDEVVAFLRDNPDGLPVLHVVGLGQGVFRVVEGPAGPVAVRDLSDLAFVRPTAGRLRVAEAERPAARLPLADLARVVRAAKGGPR